MAVPHPNLGRQASGEPQPAALRSNAYSFLRSLVLQQVIRNGVPTTERRTPPCHTTIITPQMVGFAST